VNARLACALLATAAGCSGEIRFAAATSDAAGGDGGATCAIDSDCIIDGLHCDVATHACVPCVSDGDCKGDKQRRCDAATRQCVECGLSSDCGDGGTCIAATHECVPSCSLDHEDCPSTSPTCDTARGICVGCSGDAQCTTADKLLCRVESGRCVACRIDGDCPAAGKSRCDAAGDCVRCLTGADCASGVCEPNGHVCVAK